MRRCSASILLLSLVFMAAFLTACRASTGALGKTPASPTPIVARSHYEPAPPMAVTLVLAKAPRAGEPVDVSLTFQCIDDAAGTQAEVILPEGATVTSGEVKWSGDLKANRPVTISATIQFGKEGNQELSGKAASQQPNGDVWADQASIYLHITTKEGSVGYQ